MTEETTLCGATLRTGHPAHDNVEQWECQRPAGHEGAHRSDKSYGERQRRWRDGWPGTQEYDDKHGTNYAAAFASGNDGVDGDDVDMTALATATNEPVLALFRFDDLSRGPIRECSADFAGLALLVVRGQGRSAERTLALRSLWEAKNLAVYGVSTEQRGKPDADGHIVGAERVREGSPETVTAGGVGAGVLATFTVEDDPKPVPGGGGAGAGGGGRSYAGSGVRCGDTSPSTGAVCRLAKHHGGRHTNGTSEAW